MALLPPPFAAPRGQITPEQFIQQLRQPVQVTSVMGVTGPVGPIPTTGPVGPGARPVDSLIWVEPTISHEHDLPVVVHWTAKVHGAFNHNYGKAPHLKTITAETREEALAKARAYAKALADIQEGTWEDVNPPEAPEPAEELPATDEWWTADRFQPEPA